jgi:FtsZ-binding cell division protein ZapB
VAAEVMEQLEMVVLVAVVTVVVLQLMVEPLCQVKVMLAAMVTAATHMDQVVVEELDRLVLLAQAVVTVGLVLLPV